jgi:hypothetical protein
MASQKYILTFENGGRKWRPIEEVVNVTPAQIASAIDIDSAVQNYLIAHPPTGGLTISEIKADEGIADSLSKKHAFGSDNQNLSSYDSHISSPHAPANAQKNSDITDVEIKAKYVTPAYNSVYRTLLDSSGSHIAAKAAGTYGIPQGNPLAVSGTGTLYALNTIYIATADYPTIDGKAAKLRIRCIIACNDVAPFTGTFKIGLHPVTRPATSGGAGLCIYTIGSPIVASQVTGTNLAADSLNNLVGADFDLPTDGFYVLAIVTSGTMATSSHVHISANLQIRNA